MSETLHSDCCLEGELKQCCCQCVYHRPLHNHCWTDKSRKPGTCVCSQQIGWVCACDESGGDRIYANWKEHDVGCELFTDKRESNDLLTSLAEIGAKEQGISHSEWWKDKPVNVKGEIP